MSTVTIDEKGRPGSIRSVDISTANVAKRLIHSFKLAKRKSRRKSRVTSHGAIAPSGPFLYLSGDIILEIMKNLSVTDVLSLSMTSRSLYDLSRSPTLWKSQARMHLLRSCPLIVPPSSSNPPIRSLSALPASKLYGAVIATSRLAHTWSRPLSIPIGSVRRAKVSIPLSDPRCVISCVTPRHLLIVGKVRDDHAVGIDGDQELVGWDVEKDRCVGRYRLKETLMSARAEWTSGSCYYVAGRCFGTITFEFSLIRVQFLNESATMTGYSGEHSSHDNELSSLSTAATVVMPNSLPSPKSLDADLMSAETLARFSMPFSAEITVHILDAAARMVAVLFECRSTNTPSRLNNGWYETTSDVSSRKATLGVILIFDWGTGESVVFDTDMPFSYPSATASIHLTPSRTHIVTFTDCDSRTGSEVATGERRDFGYGNQKVFEIEPLRRQAKPWEETLDGAFLERRTRVTDRGSLGMNRRKKNGLLTISTQDSGPRIGRITRAAEYRWDVRVCDSKPIRDEMDKKALKSKKTKMKKSSALAARMRRSGLLLTNEYEQVGQQAGPSRNGLASLETRGETSQSDSEATSSSPVRLIPATLPVLDSSTRICMWSRHENWPVFDDDGFSVNFAADGPGLGPAPTRTSRVSLHAKSTNALDISGSSGGKMWYIVQNYVSASPLPLTSPPLKPHKPAVVPLAVIPLTSPVLKHITTNQERNVLSVQTWPLLGITFNRVCWVEIVKPKSSSIFRRGKRVVRVATFPEPGSSGSCTKGDVPVSTLDIPSRVLRNACHLLISEVRGTITIISAANELYTYSFV